MTCRMSSYKEVAGIHAYVENPLEIIAKKAFHRADNFTPRDVFDMAVVYELRWSPLSRQKRAEVKL